jgi:hypothetical protein
MDMLEELRKYEESKNTEFLKKTQELDEKYQEKMSELDASVLKLEAVQKVKLQEDLHIAEKSMQTQATKLSSSSKKEFAEQLTKAKSKQSQAVSRILTELV